MVDERRCRDGHERDDQLVCVVCGDRVDNKLRLRIAEGNRVRVNAGFDPRIMASVFSEVEPDPNSLYRIIWKTHEFVHLENTQGVKFCAGRCRRALVKGSWVLAHYINGGTKYRCIPCALCTGLIEPKPTVHEQGMKKPV